MFATKQLHPIQWQNSFQTQASHIGPPQCPIIIVHVRHTHSHFSIVGFERILSHLANFLSLRTLNTSKIVLISNHSTCVLSQCLSMRQSLKQRTIESKFECIKSAFQHVDSAFESVVPIGSVHCLWFCVCMLFCLVSGFDVSSMTLQFVTDTLDTTQCMLQN